MDFYAVVEYDIYYMGGLEFRAFDKLRTRFSVVNTIFNPENAHIFYD